MDNGTSHKSDAVKQLRHEIWDAWFDGCNCDACAVAEAVQQDVLTRETFSLWIEGRVAAGNLRHGDGLVWPNAEGARYLRRRIGWPEWPIGELVRDVMGAMLGSESGQPLPPTSPPH